MSILFEALVIGLSTMHIFHTIGPNGPKLWKPKVKGDERIKDQKNLDYS